MKNSCYEILKKSHSKLLVGLVFEIEVCNADSNWLPSILLNSAYFFGCLLIQTSIPKTQRSKFIHERN